MSRRSSSTKPTVTGEERLAKENTLPETPAPTDAETLSQVQLDDLVPPVPTEPTESVAPAAAPVIERPQSTHKFPGQSQAVKIFLQQLEEYTQKMHPKPAILVSPQERARQQSVLFRGIYGILTHKNTDDFIAGMTQLLRVFREHRDTVFNERYVYREFANVQLSQKERQLFERLLNLLLWLTEPGLDKARVPEVVKINQTFDGLPNPDVERMMDYFRRIGVLADA